VQQSGFEWLFGNCVHFAEDEASIRDEYRSAAGITEVNKEEKTAGAASGKQKKKKKAIGAFGTLARRFLTVNSQKGRRGAESLLTKRSNRLVQRGDWGRFV